jgi:hypothetical protein
MHSLKTDSKSLSGFPEELTNYPVLSMGETCVNILVEKPEGKNYKENIVVERRIIFKGS